MVLICTLFLLVYSEGLTLYKHPNWPTSDIYINDTETHFTIGSVNVGAMAVLFLVNIAVMIILELKVLIHKIRVCQHGRRVKQHQEEQKKK